MLTEEEKEQIKQGVKNRQESAAASEEPEEDVIRRPTKVVRRVREDVDFDDDEDEVEEQEHSMDRIAAILAILAVAIIGVILVMIIGGRTGILPGSGNKDGKTAMTEEMVIMPNVVGIDASAARSALVKEGLIPELTYEESDKFTVGIVMRTSVEEGTQVPVGTTVVLTVCGNSGSKIPSVVGLTKDEAVDLLTEAGFNVNVMEASSEEVEAGYVISQDPEGGVQADGGSYVTIRVSVGPDMTGKVEMPRLLGMTEQEARNTLNAFGLKAGNVRTIIDSNPDNRGLVISQDVEPGTTIEEGTAVNFDIAGQQTYSYSADISAPTNSEDPDYKAGTSVHIVIVTEDGQKLLDTTTSAFPYRMGCTGITSEYGTLTMDYQVTITETIEEEVPVSEGEIPQEGNSGAAPAENNESQSGTKKVTRTVERTEDRTITRELTFTPEN